MTRATCPYCHNRHCPNIGGSQYLCARCGRVYTYYPPSFESKVKATSTVFLMRLARILEE